MIEKDPKICYIHSIMGVKEEYLKECKESSTVLSFWKGIKCFIDENIALVTLNIATSGNEETIGHLKKQFSILGSQNGNEDFLSHVNFFNMSGHANIKINISDISVKAFLIMFLDEGMATHSSVLFGNEIYNIETNLSMRGKRASDIQEIEISGQGAQKQKELWFKKLTTKYKEKAKEAWEKEDEGTYSYYCALVQVVNTMTQYEGFSLSRDIYTLLYPSFKLFDEQLDKALKDAKGRDNLLKMKDIKESICEFISAVNSVIYHITHTDQIFLMIPGNTGMIFSIPSKLCLMYLWVIRGVIKLLNDANYKFSCLLTPDLEASPSTKLINMGLFVNDRLIRFMTSQRFLYMPRHFMILSTHEIAHYVGKEIRNRELRFKNIAKTLSYLLAEGIFPEKLYEETDGKIAEIYEKLKEEKKAELQERCVRFIFDEYRDIKKSGNDKKEHATEIVPFLKKSYRKLLVKNGCVDKLLRSCVKEAWEGKLDDDSLKAAFITEEIQDKLEWYREMLLTSQTVVDACIDELMLIYREIFSDVAAACILGYEGETFAEVFSVSEGNKYNSAIDNKDSAKGYGDIQKKVREKILKDVFSEEADEKSVEKPDEVYTAPLNLRDELYTYQWVEIYLKKYAQKSKDDINAKIKERREELDKIRELYTLFADREATCDMIYNKIINIIIEYQKEI